MAFDVDQVMQQMENIAEVGRGIAVAFVATIYGVGAANLFLLPCAGRIRVLNSRRQALREMIVEGTAGIAESLSAGAVEQRLRPFVYVGPASAKQRPSLVTR
ncbi:MotA/TolQ/ExbB proton channel family protein [Granulicella paludicola]|uniref:MotA/TolQ/ExbB proton channel family protein n=1 Tax=Granulicella paludicola TaxID=474951 RepID=UPI0021E09510|nr:MotA/TolQ/ExbB proton channel family protein [Granulicella paludicola]